MKNETARPEMKMIGYSRPYKADPTTPAGDGIVVAAYTRGGEYRWAFALLEETMSATVKSIRANIFADALVALENRRVVRALVALAGCRTLDEAERRLRKAGIAEHPDDATGASDLFGLR